MGKTVDDRSATAKALSKSSEVTSISLLMIVPALIGYVLDQWLGTGFILMVVGLLLGMFGAGMQLMKLVSANASKIKDIDMSKVKEYEPDPEEVDDWDSKTDDKADDWD